MHEKISSQFIVSAGFFVDLVEISNIIRQKDLPGTKKISSQFIEVTIDCSIISGNE